MRVLLSIVALLPATALAFDSATENIQFEASQELFRGEDASAYFPSATSTVAIKFRADTRTEVVLDMAATSALSWPDAMAHNLNGVTGGGLAQFITETTIGADIHVNAFGQVFDLPVWDEPFSWTAETWFDHLLLPGNARTSALLTLPDAHFFDVNTDLQLAEGILLTFGLDGTPTTQATVTGTSVTMNGVSTDAPGITQLGMNGVNRGNYEIDAVWNGHIDATWGVQLVPYITVDVDSLGMLRLPLYTFDWELGTDSRSITSKVTEIDHAIPSVDTFSVLDLGDVNVGEVAEREFDVGNLGDMVLSGTATMQGDAVFDVIDRSFSAQPSGNSLITVSFAPTLDGDFEGTLILRTNDPSEPTVEVPVIGTAIPALADVPEVDPNNDGGSEYGQIRGCGCSTTSGMTGAPYAAFTLGLLALLGVRRRD